MKKRSNVVFNDVVKACEKLQEEGERVSVRNVLAITGGSFSTVAGFIRQWQEQDAINSEVALPKDLVSAIKQSFQKMLDERSTEYKAMLDREVNRTREALNQIVELESKNTDLEKEIKTQKDDLENKTKALEQQLSVAQGRLSDALTREQKLNNEYEELRQKYQSTQIELAKVETRCEALQKQIEK